MSVPILSIVFMAFSMLMGLVIPVGLCLFFRKKFGCSLKAFWAGLGVMLLFAFVLEQIIHTIVFTSPVGRVIQGNIWTYALYGGLMAGLFEETGRFLSMKFLLRKQQDNDYNALMYGAGHGGFEAGFLLILGMAYNFICAILLNTGNIGIMMNGMDTAIQAILQQELDSLVHMSPFAFLISPFERVAAVIAQLSLSVLVWFAVKNERSFKWYPIAILLHFLLDFIAVSLSGMGVPILVIELLIWIMAIGMALAAGKVWQQEKKREEDYGNA